MKKKIPTPSQVRKTEQVMLRKRSRIKYGLNNAKLRVRISSEDDEAKTTFLDSLKEGSTTIPSRSYLMSKGMWSELERLYPI